MIFDHWSQRLTSPGPKRILAIDGGGVRGALAVGILQQLEARLREKLNRPELVLSDYFDLIGGTSTGAIIAAGLALGRTTADLERLYRELGPTVFRGGFPRVPMVQTQFDPRRLERAIRHELGDATLETAAWKTGFCAIAKRVDKGSVWVISNSPGSKYWHGDPSEPEPPFGAGPRKTKPNKDYSLAQIVQASAAAPFFFDLVEIEIGLEEPGIFFDGAITPHGNPALQLAMSALIPAYGFGWSPGADQLLIVSVGTGAPKPMKPAWLKKSPLLSVWKAAHALMSISYDTSLLAVATLQWLGRSPQPWRINSEVEGLQDALPNGMAPLWTFIRYDAPLEEDWLRDSLGIEVPQKKMPALQRLTDDRQIPKLFEIGLAAGERQVRAEHLPPAFDPSGDQVKA